MNIPMTEVVADLGGEEIFRHVLPPGEYEIGREPEMPIRLNSERVSRRHALLTLSYFDWMIEDFGGLNGTTVSGKRITECSMIFPQQKVHVGDVELKLRRLRTVDAEDSMAPQVLAALKYLPQEMRGERKYRIRGMIAKGGMGVVLEAEDQATRRRVAMKTLLSTDTAEDIARFVEEAQITAQLEHPNIVRVYELNVNEQDKPFYTMQLVRGESLKQAIHAVRLERPGAHERWHLEVLLGIFLKVCDGLAYAHSKQVVHRDLKPANIMLGSFGEVLVMDWGLAKVLGDRVSGTDARTSLHSLVSSSRKDDPSLPMTHPGMAIGTPQYMSPEQAAGNSHIVDARADIYSLGAILYNLLTLRPPFRASDPEEVLQKVVEGAITPFEEAVKDQALAHLPGGKLPAKLLKVVLKAMSLDPNDRYETVHELQEEVRSASGQKNGVLALFGWGGDERKPEVPRHR